MKGLSPAIRRRRYRKLKALCGAQNAGGRVLFHTHYNEYFKENVHMFKPLDFLAELTQHIPPKGVQLIRRYGLYSSRIKGAWESMPHVAERAPAGWKIQHKSQTGTSDPGDFDTFEDTDFLN